MRTKLLVFLMVCPFLISSSCGGGGATTEYVTHAEFSEYRRKHGEDAETATVIDHKVLQHYKWLTKIEIEACDAINVMLNNNNSHAHCTGVVVVDGRPQEAGFTAVVQVVTLGKVHRCLVLLTWDRENKLHIYPEQPPEGSGFDYWQEVL